MKLAFVHRNYFASSGKSLFPGNTIVDVSTPRHMRFHSDLSEVKIVNITSVITLLCYLQVIVQQ